MAGEIFPERIAKALTAKQFLAWEAYNSIDPFGKVRDDYLAASIRETIYNVAVVAKDRKPLDYFLVRFGPEKEDETVDLKAIPATGQTWQQKKSIMYAIIEAYKVKSPRRAVD